jgi:hypothetical protein
MTTRNSVAIVENFWHEVWQRPQNPHAIDRLVHEDFILTLGGTEIRSREAFKAWAKNFQALVQDFEFQVVESFQNPDGSRVASRWRIKGHNAGLMVGVGLVTLMFYSRRTGYDEAPKARRTDEDDSA